MLGTWRALRSRLPSERKSKSLKKQMNTLGFPLWLSFLSLLFEGLMSKWGLMELLVGRPQGPRQRKVGVWSSQNTGAFGENIGKSACSSQTTKKGHSCRSPCGCYRPAEVYLEQEKDSGAPSNGSLYLILYSEKSVRSLSLS